MKSEPCLIYGKHTVRAYLAASKVKTLYYSANDVIASLKHDGLLQGVSCQLLASAQLDKTVKGGNHQGLVAEISHYELLGASTLEAIFHTEEDSSCVLVLDQIQDPHNLGACLRTAAVAGVAAVIIPKDRSVGLTASVAKVASGALGLVPVVEVTNLVRHMKWLKHQGFWIYGADETGQQSIYEQKLTGKVAWIMGNEGKGMRALTRTHCDVICQIPSSDKLSCLNVSVATGVCLFETLRQKSTFSSITK